MAIRDVEAAALELQPLERAQLAQRLMASLDRDPGVEAAWNEEIRRRVADFEAGHVELIPADEALAKLRARLNL